MMQPDGFPLSNLRRLLLQSASMATLAVAVITAQQSSPASGQPSAANAVPAKPAPDRYFAGVPWTGRAGTTETVAEIMARAANEPEVTEPPRERRRRRLAHVQKDRPGAAAVPQW